MSIFSVHNVFFTVIGYPMSYIELSATLLITVYVLLITRKIVWAWPLGIVTFSLFAVLFYQVRLYSDFFEQFYYIGNCFYGWYVWRASRPRRFASPAAASPDASQGGEQKRSSGGADAKELEVSYTSGKGRLIACVIIAAGGIILGFTMSRIHTWLPALFPQQAAYPYIDATATVMGFVAAALMTHRKIEAWILWLCVNSICIGLYYARDVKFVAILYIFFLALAVNGLITWTREFRRKASSAERS
jgi:nicotinamide mononucleotide transporter